MGLRTGRHTYAVTPHPQKDKTHRSQCKMSSSKKLTCKGTLRQMFIIFIDWRQPISCVYSVMLVFSTQLCDLYSPLQLQQPLSVCNIDIRESCQETASLRLGLSKIEFHITLILLCVRTSGRILEVWWMPEWVLWLQYATYACVTVSGSSFSYLQNMAIANLFKMANAKKTCLQP